MDVKIIDNTEGLAATCKQTLKGRSDCYGAVIFATFNDTNVDYSIVLDSEFNDNSGGWGNWRRGENTLTNRVLPLQWAVNSVIVSLLSMLKVSSKIYVPATSTGILLTRTLFREASPQVLHPQLRHGLDFLVQMRRCGVRTITVLKPLMPLMNMRCGFLWLRLLSLPYSSSYSSELFITCRPSLRQNERHQWPS